MATLSSIPNALLLCSRRSKSPAELPTISLLRFEAAAPTSPSSFRQSSSHFQRFGILGNSRGWQKLHIAFASNNNPSDQDALTEKGDGGAQGPPLLTILAGVVVFLFISWVIGSIVMWLIGLIVGIRPS